MESTITLGLIGYPVHHSLSPVIHNAALRAVGIQGTYHAFEVKPLPEGQEDLIDILEKLRNAKLHGLNVTIPHKQTVLPHLDTLSPLSRAIGAVNTICRREGQLIGYNTDVPGFLTDLWIHHSEFWDRKRRYALILGAGGAARAVAFALLATGWHISIASRRYTQAKELSNTLKSLQSDLFQILSFSEEWESVPGEIQTSFLLSSNKMRVQAIPLDALTRSKQFSPLLIVNATPLGMSPNVSLSPLPEDFIYPKGTVVYDLVYSPLITTLIKKAKEQGAAVVSGIGMLIEQAALSFELWTRIRAPKVSMYQAVDVALRGKAKGG